MPTPWIQATFLAVLGTGCGLAAPARGLSVGGGAAEATYEVRANHTDLLAVHVTYPSLDTGEPLPGRHPAVVFVQGGFVAASRYLWQARELARRGYVVAVPEHPLALAFFSIENGAAARGLLLEPPAGSVLQGQVDAARLAVAGHSLGGVVAMKLALQGGFAGVVLEASFPDGADAPALPGLGHPSLSLAGSLDCSASLAAVRSGWDQLPSPTALQVLTGATHYQFTDADTEDQQRGCLPGVTLEVAHQAMMDAVDGFLRGAFADGGIDEAALRAVPGSSLEVRP
jgi:dienelactone hydrolase